MLFKKTTFYWILITVIVLVIVLFFLIWLFTQITKNETIRNNDQTDVEIQTPEKQRPPDEQGADTDTEALPNEKSPVKFIYP